MVSKRCTKCNEIRTLSEFSPSAMTKDGVVSWCRRCVSAYGFKRRGKEVVSVNQRFVNMVTKRLDNIKLYFVEISAITFDDENDSGSLTITWKKKRKGSV